MEVKIILKRVSYQIFMGSETKFFKILTKPGAFVKNFIFFKKYSLNYTTFYKKCQAFYCLKKNKGRYDLRRTSLFYTIYLFQNAII